MLKHGSTALSTRLCGSSVARLISPSSLTEAGEGTRFFNNHDDESLTQFATIDTRNIVSGKRSSITFDSTKTKKSRGKNLRKTRPNATKDLEELEIRIMQAEVLGGTETKTLMSEIEGMFVQSCGFGKKGGVLRRLWRAMRAISKVMESGLEAE
jgi:hypothetical protein